MKLIRRNYGTARKKNWSKKEKVLSSIENLKMYSDEAYQTLQEDDGSVNSTPAIDKLSSAQRTMKKLVELDPSLREQLKCIEDAVLSLTEVARDLRTYNASLNYDEGSLENHRNTAGVNPAFKEKIRANNHGSAGIQQKDGGRA